MADKKNIVPSPLTLVVLSDRTYRERIAKDRGEVQQFDEDDDLDYILYFKDRAVFSLNATGAFSDGITRAVKLSL